MPTYAPTKQLVSAVCTHLFQAGSTVRNIESWGYRVLPHIMRAHGQTHKQGEYVLTAVSLSTQHPTNFSFTSYWTLHFDTSPTTLESLRHLLKHNQMVLRFTITNVASTVEQSAQQGRHLTLSHPNSKQAARQKEFQPIKFSRGSGPALGGVGQGQVDGVEAYGDVDVDVDVDGMDGTGYTTLPDSPYASPYSGGSSTPASIYARPPSSDSSDRDPGSSQHQLDILETYMSAAQIANTPGGAGEATLVDSPQRTDSKFVDAMRMYAENVVGPGLRDMVRKESSKAWRDGGAPGDGPGAAEDWVFPSAPSQKPRPGSGSGAGGSGRKGRGSGIA
jgi:ribosomal protein S6